MAFVKAGPFGAIGADVLYIADDGTRTVRSGGSRAWRNHNPGNIIVRSLSMLDRLASGLSIFQVLQLFALSGGPAVAADRGHACKKIRYETKVSLSGTLILKTVPATPEDAELGPGGAHVRVYVLRLDRPLCAAPNPQDELNQAADDVREVQVVVAEDRLAALLRARLGRHVVVEGEAWSWHTAHHYTPVLISLEKLSLASR